MAERAPAGPAAALLAPLRELLMRHPPFAQMPARQVERLLEGAVETYHAPGETVLSPASGVVDALRWIRQGAVQVIHGGTPETIGAGELFPVGAALAARAVTSTYVAQADLFCLLLPAARVREVAADCAPLADYLTRRVWKLLDDSRRSLQASISAPALAEHTLDMPLAALARRDPVVLPGDTPVGAALERMRDAAIGSVLVAGASGDAEGIFTRHDVLDRIALAGRALDTPLSAVMSAPLVTLDAAASGHDAAIAMSRHGLRHVPVSAGGRVVGIVSERDLFALQRLSLTGVVAAVRAAGDGGALVAAAADIRRLARNLVAQGTGARALTALVTHLNDELAARVVALHAADAGIDPAAFCWLAFGSEGRGEQTIATDQDNGLVFVADGDAGRERPRWMAFGARVNDTLDACGYPLCKGGVMARNADCCRTAAEWLERFEHWMEHGAPEDLLAASIYFDLRPVAGNRALAAPLRARITERAAELPRLHRQLAENVLQRRPPIGWLGGLEAHAREGREVIDLKLAGTAIFVDAARLYALANGVDETGTRARFEAVAPRIGAPSSEADAWIAGFEFLQMQRLAVQLRDEAGAAPNLVEPDALNAIDRRVLVETMRVARRLQQRIELDYSEMIFGRRFAADARRWLVVDVEASGLDAARDRLLAVAGVALAIDGEATPRIALGDSFQAVLAQHDTIAPDKENILVHGIGVGAQRGGAPPADALAAFERWIGASPLLAFHSAFDETLLRRAFRGALGRVPKNPWLDLAAIAPLARPDVAAAHTLDDWLAAAGIACLARHDAAADALATAELLLWLWPALRAQGGALDAAALRRLANSSRWLGG